MGTLWEAMAGLVTRLLGLLALVLVFVASIGAKRGGEKENGRRVEVLEGEGFEGAGLKRREPYWGGGMARRREYEKDKRKNELTKKRSSSKKRRAPKKTKKNR